MEEETRKNKYKWEQFFFYFIFLSHWFNILLKVNWVFGCVYVYTHIHTSSSSFVCFSCIEYLICGGGADVQIYFVLYEQGIAI